MTEFEKTSWLASRCMGNILFIDHDVENITYEDLEEELGYYGLDFVNIYQEDGHMVWILKGKPLTLEVYPIHDGWGEVGVGWICPYCNKHHPFERVRVKEEYVCEECNQTSISECNSYY